MLSKVTKDPRHRSFFQRLIFLDLNESSLYMFRIKSMNIYGESPWSMDIPVQTIESIVTADGWANLRERKVLLI